MIMLLNIKTIKNTTRIPLNISSKYTFLYPVQPTGFFCIHVFKLGLKIVQLLVLFFSSEIRLRPTSYAVLRIVTGTPVTSCLTVTYLHGYSKPPRHF